MPCRPCLVVLVLVPPQAATHGDEVCGVLAVNELIAEGFLADACVRHNVSLTVVMGNPRAVA